MDNEIVYLYLDDIIPNRFQPRELFDEKALKELAISIREHGVIQPIIVRKIGSKYEIIAGERRYKASTMAGLTKIPAIIKNLDDKESSKVALIENLQRRDLTSIEEARTYQKILDIDSLTQEELANTLGKSQSAVSNKLRLLTLPSKVQDALLNEKISERHARSLLNVESDAEKERLTDIIIEKRLSVKELEEMIKNGTTDETSSQNNISNTTFDAIPEFSLADQNNVNNEIKDDDLGAFDFNKVLNDFVKNNELKAKDQEKEDIKREDISSKEETDKNSNDIEVLDLLEDDNYYSFMGLKQSNKTKFEECIEMVRDIVSKIEEKGYKIKNDE